MIAFNMIFAFNS